MRVLFRVKTAAHDRPRGRLELARMPKRIRRACKNVRSRWQAECKPCKYFLKMRLACNDEGFISMPQPHYADHMAKVFNLQSEKVARTPLPPGTSVSKLERANFKEKTHHKLVESRVTPVQQKQKAKQKKHRLSKQTAGENVQRAVMDNVTTSTTDSSETDALMGKNLTRFKEAWGQLSYCATASRPDLCYADSLLGQVSAGPRMRHWRLAQQVIQYAFNTKTYGIQPRTHGVRFRKTEPSSTRSEKARWPDHKQGMCSCPMADQ